VVPEWQQSAQAGRRLHGQNPTNKAQIERIEELLKVRAVGCSCTTACSGIAIIASMVGSYKM
jgi:hypothetical protein